MHALGFEKRHPARVRVIERVGRGNAADGFLDRGDALRVFRNRRKCFLMVSQRCQIEGEKSCEVWSVPGQVGGVHGDIIGWSDPYFIRWQAELQRNSASSGSSIFCAGSPVIAGSCERRGMPSFTRIFPALSFHTRAGVPGTPKRSISLVFASNCAEGAFFAGAIPPS